MANIKRFNQFIKENYNDGNVMNICQDCQGDGIVEELDCVSCKGLGFFPTSEEDIIVDNELLAFENKNNDVECSHCEGTGINLEGGDCHFCEGIGYVNSDHGMSKIYSEEEEENKKLPPCPNCDGDGKLDGYVCDYCEGSGRIPLTDNYNELHEKKGEKNR